MNNNFKNWVVAKIVDDINCMNPNHRKFVVQSIQLSEGLIGAIELTMSEYIEEYAKINDSDNVMSVGRSDVEEIHQAIREHFAQELEVAT